MDAEEAERRRRIRPATGRQDMPRRPPPGGAAPPHAGEAGEEGHTLRTEPLGARYYAKQRSIGRKLLGCLPYAAGAIVLVGLALLVLAFGPDQDQDDLPIVPPEAMQEEPDALELQEAAPPAFDPGPAEDEP